MTTEHKFETLYKKAKTGKKGTNKNLLNVFIDSCKVVPSATLFLTLPATLEPKDAISIKCIIKKQDTTIEPRTILIMLVVPIKSRFIII